MVFEGELRVFLRRTAEGAYRLESEDGSLVLQSGSYRELRGDLDRLMGAAAIPSRVKIMLGSPRRAAAAAWSAQSAELRS